MMQAEAVVADHVPAELREAVLSARMPGERLLWCGCQNAQDMARQTLPIAYWGIAWNTIWILLLWKMGAFDRGTFADPQVMLLACFPLLIGILLLFTPRLNAHLARNVVYAITDHRILTLTRRGKGDMQTESYVPAPGSEFECTVRRDGTGNLTYAKLPIPQGEGGSQTRTRTFQCISNVREVERLLWSTFMSAPTSRSAESPRPLNGVE